MLLVLMFSAYVIIGLGIMGVAIYQEWRQGNDILWEDVRDNWLMIAIWPVCVLMLVGDATQTWRNKYGFRAWLNSRNGVLIRGSLSAKVENALRESGDKK